MKLCRDIHTENVTDPKLAELSQSAFCPLPAGHCPGISVVLSENNGQRMSLLHPPGSTVKTHLKRLAAFLSGDAQAEPPTTGPAASPTGQCLARDKSFRVSVAG